MAISNGVPAMLIVLAMTACTTLYPATLSKLFTCTVFVTSLVTPRLRPCSIRKLPRVMMKLGSPVRITRYPLTNPIPSTSARDSASAAQRLSP
jgi:hypothetical protein